MLRLTQKESLPSGGFRDAFFLDYSPVLISDAAMAAGSSAMRAATLFNEESFFGRTV